MKISKEKLDRLRARARTTAGKIGGGAKTSALAAATGALAAEVGVHALSKVDAISSRWYAPGAVIALAGHLVRKKNQTVGLALLGAGGFALAQGYELNKAKTDSESDGSTSGVGDAGALADNIFRPRQFGMQPVAGYYPMPEAYGPAPSFAEAGAIQTPQWGDAGAIIEAEQLR